MNDPSAGGKYRGGWSGNRFRASGRNRAYSDGGSSPHQPVPSTGCSRKIRPPTYDEDQALAPAPCVLSGLGILGGREPLLEESEFTGSERVRRAGERERDQHRDDDRSQAERSPERRDPDQRRNRQVEAEQARERSRRAGFPRTRRSPRRVASGRAGADSRAPRTRRRDTRSTGRRGRARRGTTAGACRDSAQIRRAPTPAAEAVTITISSTTIQRRSVESIRTTQPTRSTVSETSFPAATNAVPPFASPVARMSAANAAAVISDRPRPAGIRTGAPDAQRDRGDEPGQQQVAEDDPDRRTCQPDRESRLVDGLDQREANRGEKQGKCRIPRLPQRALTQVGHRCAYDRSTRRNQPHLTARLAHAHRLPHGHLAAGCRWTRNPRAGVLAVPRGARAPGRRRHDGRRRADGQAVRGRRRLPGFEFSRAVRPRRARGDPPCAYRRPRVRDCHVRSRELCILGVADASRGEARLRPGVRACSPVSVSSTGHSRSSRSRDRFRSRL